MDKKRELDLADVLVWLFMKRRLIITFSLIFAVAFAFIFLLKTYGKSSSSTYKIAAKYVVVVGRYENFRYPNRNTLILYFREAFADKGLSVSVNANADYPARPNVIVVSVVSSFKGREEEAVKKFRDAVALAGEYLLKPYENLTSQQFFREKSRELDYLLKSVNERKLNVPSDAYRGILTAMLSVKYRYSPPALVEVQPPRVTFLKSSGAGAGGRSFVRLMIWALVGLVSGALLGVICAGFIDLVKEAKNRLEQLEAGS